MYLNRKKSILFVSVIVVLLIIIFVQIAGYYHATYVTEVGYAKTPVKIPKKQRTKDINGKVTPNSYSYMYQFDFVNKKGERRSLSYELSGKNIEPLRKDSFVKADISKKRVVKGPYIIHQSKVPKNIVNKLK